MTSNRSLWMSCSNWRKKKKKIILKIIHNFFSFLFYERKYLLELFSFFIQILTSDVAFLLYFLLMPLTLAAGLLHLQTKLTKQLGRKFSMFLFFLPPSFFFEIKLLSLQYRLLSMWCIFLSFAGEMEISLDDRFDVIRLLCVNVALSHAVCLTKMKIFQS